MASVLTPIDGMVHEWMTSLDVTTIWVVRFVGILRDLEHFRSRKVLLFSINESSSSSIRLCSYLQYH